MKSMTGYGTAEGKIGKGRMFIEVKTINHRFCDIDIKHPPKMGVLEPLIKIYLQNKYMRGKVNVFIKEKSPLFSDTQLFVDERLARKYQRCLQKLSKELNLRGHDDFLRYVGLDHFITVQEKEGNYGRFWKQIETLLSRACAHVDRMREREGEHIQQDQKKRILKLTKLILQIRKQSSRALEKHKSRMRKRISKNGPIDDKRLDVEVAYIGTRQDIAEELTRFESHIKQYSGLLKKKEEVGRKLDFLLQEINREVNTIGSKAGDAAISRLVVDVKTELERLREQIQNVE